MAGGRSAREPRSASEATAQVGRKRARRRAAAVTLAVALVALGAPAWSPASAAPLPCGPSERDDQMEVVQLNTFHIAISPGKKRYRAGEVATIKAEVTRPAREDPLGQGVPIDPPMSFPAEDVNVGVGVQVERVYLFGMARTDADGKATVKIRIQPYTPPGSAHVRALAWSTTADTPCLTVEEQGYTQKPNFFKITR